MHIVSQSVFRSHCLFPPELMLAAPQPMKALPAPRIAGLLTAGTSVQAGEFSQDDLFSQLGPIRSRTDMNAEIAEMLFDTFDYLRKGRAQ